MSKFDQQLWQEIGARLKEVRAGQPTAQFLVDHGLSPRIPWNSVEIGNRGLDVQTLKQICEAIGVSLDWLILGHSRVKKSQIKSIASRT